MIPIRLYFAVLSLSNSWRPFSFLLVDFDDIKFSRRSRWQSLASAWRQILAADVILQRAEPSVRLQTRLFGCRTEGGPSTLDLLQGPVTVLCLPRRRKPLQTSRRRRECAPRPGPEPTAYPAFRTLPRDMHKQGSSRAKPYPSNRAKTLFKRAKLSLNEPSYRGLGLAIGSFACQGQEGGLLPN